MRTYTEDEMRDGLLAFARQHHPLVTLELTHIQVFTVISQMQLALRHPGNDGASEATSRDMLQKMIDKIAPDDGPLRALLIAGFDPSQDR